MNKGHCIYIKFDKHNQFCGFNIFFKNDILPENCIIITDQQHQEYLNALNTQNKKIIKDVNSKIKIIDKYTSEELKEQEEEHRKNVLLAKGKVLLNIHSYKWSNNILWNKYTDQQKKQLEEFYFAALALSKGETEEIPKELSF